VGEYEYVTCRVMKQETSVGYTEAMHALVISLEEISKGKENSAAWKVPLVWRL
jgi:hypothetical protein